MSSIAVRAVTLALVLATTFPLVGARAADPWRPISRAEALTRASSGQLEQRRQAYARLGEVGLMEDTPVLLSALRDDEDLIRGVAEISLWGIWMRADDSTADPLFQVAMDLMQQMKLAEAEAKFDEVIAMRPDFAEAWHRRAETRVLGDRWGEAAQDFAHALELNPFHFGAMEGLAHCNMRSGRAAEAVQLFLRALELNPNLEQLIEPLKRARAMAERDRT